MGLPATAWERLCWTGAMGAGFRQQGEGGSFLEHQVQGLTDPLATHKAGAP